MNLDDMKTKIKKELTDEITHPFFALSFSLAGVLSAVKQERAFRHELLLGSVHFTALAYFDMSHSTRILMIIIWFILLSVELLNSAVEAIVDKVSPEQNILAKRAKDCGSAAVFIILCGMVVVWCYILALKLFSH